MNIKVLLAWSIVFVAVLSLGIGCAQSPDLEQERALEEQQQENEELQQELQDQRDREEEARKQEDAERQEELQQEVDDLRKEVEEKENEDQQESQSDPEPNSPDVVIESNGNWTAPPAQAPQGVVVVSPNYDVQAVDAEEAQVLDGAIAYYQAAEVGDYYATYSLLSTSDQELYTVDQWIQSNTTLDSAAGEFIVTDAYPEDVGNGSPTYAVELTVYLPDGSSFDRKTYFTNEGNGFWAHWLNQEEIDMFNGAL